MKKVLILTLALLICCTSALALQLPKVGAEAPDFEVQLLDGTTFVLSEQRRKVVLMNIWATWCGPCVAEMPDIQQISLDYPEDVVVIGVNCGEDEETVRKFVEENGYTYNFGLDTDYMVSGLLYPAQAIPYTIVIDPHGIITQLHLGGGMNMYEVFDAYIQQALENVAEKFNGSGAKILA